MNPQPGCLPAAAIVLAAGAARRMGTLKQLLPYKGRPLVRHAARQAIEAGFSPVIVVAGAQADEIRAAIASEPVEIVENGHWATGMGSSLSAGVRHLLEMETDVAAVAVLLADQPLVSSEHLRSMRNRLHLVSAPVIAAEYNGTVGVPALFRRSLLAQLSALPPEMGARALLRDPSLAVDAFPLPEAASDIDTPDDYAGLDQALGGG